MTQAATGATRTGGRSAMVSMLNRLPSVHVKSGVARPPSVPPLPDVIAAKESPVTAQDRVQDLNRQAWDHAVDRGDNPYTHIVSSARVAAARRGDWSLTVSEQRPVPRHWLEPLAGARVLCLASGGGQQAPILAADDTATVEELRHERAQLPIPT
ncbi:hypothetical protein [Dactylosporangium sp. NPDC006015]|uniref:hypothetical protein n=1 Tax=Dactylosporangium sp. NPDC006015 TaxID=3154576 RepID=UPI00339F74EF